MAVFSVVRYPGLLIPVLSWRHSADKVSVLMTEASDVANQNRQVINEAIVSMHDIESGALRVSNMISENDGMRFGPT